MDNELKDEILDVISHLIATNIISLFMFILIDINIMFGVYPFNFRMSLLIFILAITNVIYFLQRQ